MAETAAHVVDWVFPKRPVSQWVLSVPKRLRCFIKRASSVLHIFVRVVEEQLRLSSPGAGPQGRLGAVSFLHRFGARFNAHWHFHCGVIDGVFAPDANGQLQFYEATALSSTDAQAVAARVRARVLKWMVRQDLLGRLAALIPPPRVYRHRYHGVLAPHSPWRAEITTRAAEPPVYAATPPPPLGQHTVGRDRASARYL